MLRECSELKFTLFYVTHFRFVELYTDKLNFEYKWEYFFLLICDTTHVVYFNFSGGIAESQPD